MQLNYNERASEAKNKMNNKFILTAVILFAAIVLRAQTDHPIVGKDIRLPKDSIERLQLLNSLDSFLIETRQELYENKRVLPLEKSETDILIGELKEIYKKQKSGASLKPYLTNIVPIHNGQYLTQFAFLGIREGQPYLQASFEFVATRKNNTFLFSSTLSQNTKEWKVITDSYLSAYFQSTEDEYFANQYMHFVKEFDAKLSISQPTAFYFCEGCETLHQLLQLSGIQYQSDYNGLAWRMTNFDTPGKIFNFYTKSFFYQQTADPHDIFHARAAIAIPDSLQNHYMICGCAYVYGGSWLISWTDIQKMFKSKMSHNKKNDWLKLYFERYNFGESKEKHLLVTQFVNALIVEKVEKEQGFSAVMKLLASGDMFKAKENFFGTLEKITGINEKNFNQKVGRIIDEAMEKI